MIRLFYCLPVQKMISGIVPGIYLRWTLSLRFLNIFHPFEKLWLYLLLYTAVYCSIHIFYFLDANPYGGGLKGCAVKAPPGDFACL